MARTLYLSRGQLTGAKMESLGLVREVCVFKDGEEGKVRTNMQARHGFVV